VKIFQDLTAINSIPNPVLTIGTFDGVHVGHQKILQQVKKEAEKIGGESVLFTFFPHPRMVLYPESHGLKLLQTQEEKMAKLARVGVENCIVYPFTFDFSRLSAVEFVRDILVNKLKIKKLVIGYDHQFGKNREGNIEFLKEICEVYGFEVIEIPAQDIDAVNVSSTKIRKAILDGEIAKANEYLGERFELTGTIVHGQAIGKSIGFPTANIQVDSDLKLIPGNGVYAVDVCVKDSDYIGMLNIGNRPTVNDSADRTIEVHILDFSGAIYAEEITVKFIDKLRDEKQFIDLQELQNQLKEDEKFIRTKYLDFN
jgi:riboflavin kinase/FMN adenylyltransferase